MTANDKQLQEDIKALGRAFKDQPSVAQDAMDLIQTKVNPPTKASRLSDIRRLIMNRQFRQIAIAATVLILLGVIVWLTDGALDGTTRVYAMSDVPDLFRKARTLHMKARTFQPKRDGSNTLEAAEVEIWLDLENQRWRNIKPVYDNHGTPISTINEIYNGGEYATRLDHQNKQVTLRRMTPFKKACKVREALDILLQLSFGDPKYFDQYEQYGQEKLDDRLYDIWQVDIQVSKSVARIRSWFSPETGQVSKSEISFKRNEISEWQKQGEVYLIEKDVPIDNQIFQQSIPKDYSETSIDATIPGSSQLYNSRLKLWTYLFFRLNDGSILACWRSRDQENETSPISLLTGIKPSAEFPELPVVVNGLSCRDSRNNMESSYHGYYLAHTVHDSDVFLWGLYVALDVEEPAFGKTYTVLHQTNVPDRTLKGSLSTENIIDVENQQDFEAFVLAAMADFSDPNATLPALTYDETLRLAQEIRNTLK
jgi:hypothetical protein